MGAQENKQTARDAYAAFADVLTYNSAGKLVAFETLGDSTVADRVFAE